MTKTNDSAPERRTYSWVFIEAALRRYERRERMLRWALCIVLLLSAALVAAVLGGFAR